MLVRNNFTLVENADNLLDIYALDNSLILITENGLYAPTERLLVEDGTCDVREEFGNPKILPADMKLSRVLQYRVLLCHLAGVPHCKRVSTMDRNLNMWRNRLAQAIYDRHVLRAQALVICDEKEYLVPSRREGRHVAEDPLVPAFIQKAILAGDMESARLMLIDPASTIKSSFYHILVRYGFDFRGEIHKPSFQKALQEQDYEAMKLMFQDSYPMSYAALINDWDMVQRLVKYGCDPNLGPSFIERSLAVSVMRGRLEETEFLLRNQATRDLGDQLYPLREAVLRRNIADAQAVLRRPRLLRLATIETKRRTLQRKFLEVYNVFQAGSQRNNISQKFKDFRTSLDSHRSMWRNGMAGVRRLVKNRSPKDLQQVIGILCVASAMRESMPSDESFGSYDLFVEDLDRWRQLAVHPHHQELFDEIASAIWGKRESLTRTPNVLDEQSEDRDRLYQMIRKLVERFGVESSLPLSILENVDHFWD